MSIEKLDVPKVVEVRHLKLEKDGTKYEQLAFKIEGDFYFGSLGCVSNGWLVIDHLNRRAYLFQPAGYLDEAYVYEKLCAKAYELSKKDAENITTLLRQLIDRP